MLSRQYLFGTRSQNSQCMVWWLGAGGWLHASLCRLAPKPHDFVGHDGGPVSFSSLHAASNGSRVTFRSPFCAVAIIRLNSLANAAHCRIVKNSYRNEPKNRQHSHAIPPFACTRRAEWWRGNRTKIGRPPNKPGTGVACLRVSDGNLNLRYAAAQLVIHRVCCLNRP